jgi:hypothetical protein
MRVFAGERKTGQRPESGGKPDPPHNNFPLIGTGIPAIMTMTLRAKAAIFW